METDTDLGRPGKSVPLPEPRLRQGVQDAGCYHQPPRERVLRLHPLQQRAAWYQRYDQREQADWLLIIDGGGWRGGTGGAGVCGQDMLCTV